jgi:hypothetical protein
MNKATKFIVAILALGVSVVCVGMGYTAVKNGEDKTTTVATVVPTTNPTTAPTTTEPTTVREPQLSELLIGKWSDSAGMSGFEFFSDGKASFTYANLGALGISFDGKLENGTYKLEGNKLTIAYSIYSATIDKTYEISIEDDVLKMKRTDDGKTSSYIRTDSFEGMDIVTNGISTPDELIGSWENKALSKSYSFAQNGKVTVKVKGESFGGVYVTEGNDVTIQYSAAAVKCTEKYSFAVTKSNLALTDSDGSTFNYSRMGTDINPSVSSDSLLGVWRDSVNMSGYEFKEGDVVSVTFVNFRIPVIDVPVNGTFTGGYEVEDGVLNLTYYIYGKKITGSYTYEINGNTLKLKDTETGNVSTYIKQ